MAVEGPPPGPAGVPAPAAPASTGVPAAVRKIGEYSIQRELGRGGMGAVYLAEHDRTHEKVAIKELLITAAADPVAVTRFLQEGEVMSRLTHPNIVGVRDIIQAGAGHYLALELIDGGSLRDLCTGRPLPIPKAFAVMHGLLNALDYAHQHAIVHRDVKPENVMLSLAGGVKVADFGIARLTDDSALSNATKTGTTVGTPQYMSPEQVTTSKVDGRSDLYSAGIVCYEVFCGRPPFEATAEDGPFTLFAKHVQAPPPPPSVRRPGLDPEIERIILKSLSKRPEDRYQTGAEFDRELILVANRLCGPNWVHALEPGADLAAMVPPALDRTMVLPTRAPGVASAAAPVPSSPAYAPRPPQRAVPAPPGGPNRVLVGGIVAAVLVVAAIVAVVALGGRPASGPSTPTATNKAPGVASCDYLRTGVAPATGAGGTCGLKLGNQVQADSMAGLSALPADLRPIGVDSNMAPNRTLPNVPVSGGFATLAAPSKGAGPALTTNLGPVDEVVIADFTPTSTADADIGVGLRCSTTDCLLVYVSPAGSVWISQRTAGKELAQKFKDSAQVPVNQVNRLVVVVKGSQVQAWLNGNLVGTVSTDVAGAGTAIFYNVDQDSRPSTVNLSDFYVFQPS